MNIVNSLSNFTVHSFFSLFGRGSAVVTADFSFLYVSRLDISYSLGFYYRPLFLQRIFFFTFQLLCFLYPLQETKTRQLRVTGFIFWGEVRG